MISDLFATNAWNGRQRAVTESFHRELTPEEQVGWAALRKSVDDLKLLCRYGVITRDGECNEWPTTVVTQWGRPVRVYVSIDHMRDPGDARALKYFFLEGFGQTLCDWVGCRFPASEMFWQTVKNHGAAK